VDAIVTAGGKPAPGDPLYSCTQGRHKALLDINGKPMIQWVFDTLDKSQSIDKLFVVGLNQLDGLHCDKPIVLLDDRGDMVDNIRAGAEKALEANPKATHVLVVSSDIPAITPEVVDWLVAAVQAADYGLYYNVVERSTMEGKFPTSRRTYVHLKEGEFCGGDMNAISIATALEKEPYWQKIIDARKSPAKQAVLIGLDVLFLLFIGQLSLYQAESIISRRLRIKAKVLLSPYAEIGMDVDKPFQLEIMKAYLANRGTS
jgi:GTP:adenosylcobinamide-phosphate guanylyltransferase